MSSQDQASPRARGRPAAPEHALKQQVLDAATELLLSQGYQAATMAAVAQRAGVAKKTVYRFADNSEQLLGAVIHGWTDAFVAPMSEPLTEAAALPQALEALLNTVAAKVLTREAVGLFRLLIGDFPGREQALAQYAEHGVQRCAALLAGWLERQAEQGLIRCPQPAQTAELLLAMTIAEPLRRMALGLTPPLPEHDPGERICAAVALCCAGLLPR
ncbi:TetR/AcrR family transcriptional regulator [Chromobacterium sp. Panama]|uniref:TetR/AcrR family transcriptional regulator n=1 Tax=Chromobacterium sp. Panama TaxID=2161826 RepID=UPI000D2F8E25|nr:TetR/AcrR family transcriptional regulator [Chromobacterium sp. Panama]PTU65733.1 TetR/AcrR family transcriptional regulator [Chromobacterium sp. Panama]